MAKAAAAATNGSEKKAPPQNDDPLAFLYAEAASDAPDIGTSAAPEDNLVPLIYILQPLSPQVLEGSDTYMPGAKAGTIWLRNFAEPFIDGNVGILFQPCCFSKDWIEWIPRKAGGGFVARHEECPPGAELVEDDENGRVVHRLPNGNEVVEVRYHMGYVHRGVDQRLPFVIPMTSTGHTVSKNWVFNMNQRRLPNGMRAKSFMGLYRLRTKLRKNKKGAWFAFEVTEEGFITSPNDMIAAKELQDAFRLGVKQSETPLITHYDAGLAGGDTADEPNTAEHAGEAPM
jgi:hypothetical protein